MSRTYHHGERRTRARGIRKNPPKIRRLARGLIALAQAQADADAETQAKKRQQTAVGTSPAVKHLVRPRESEPRSTQQRKDTA